MLQVPTTDGKALVLLDEADSDLGMYALYMRKGYVELTIRQGMRKQLGVLVLERVLGRKLLDGLEVDHIDRNPFNNQRYNLREVTHLENQQNKTPQKKRQSWPDNGILWIAPWKKWIVRVGGKTVAVALTRQAAIAQRNDNLMKGKVGKRLMVAELLDGEE